MVVKTQDKHPGRHGAVGLHIGAENVQRYFPIDVSSIELELDHLQIACSLDPSFWQDYEIHDTRLSSWLESKRNSGKLGPREAPVAMVPCGKFAFKVQIGVETIPRDNADYALTCAPAQAYGSSPVAPPALPATLLDRRKRNLVHELGVQPGLASSW